jgi:hypothetical protein
MNLSVKFVCTLCTLVSCSGNPSIKYLTDLEQANIKGHLKKLITETYELDSLGHMGKLMSERIEMFDELGYTITDTAKDFIERNEVVNFLNYNKNGSLASLITFENGKKQSKMSLKYNNDKCISVNIYDSNDKLETYYDNISQTKYGLLSSLNSHDANGRLTMSFVNEYDSIYQIGAIAKNSIGKLKSKVRISLTSKMDQENMLEISYFKDSSVQKFLSYKYENWDTTGNWIQQTIYDDNGKSIKIVKRIFSYR